jgi:hypothetical protein
LTHKAIEADKAEAGKAEDVNKAIAIVADMDKAEEAIVANEADVADQANEADEADKAVDCNEAKVDEANEANFANETNKAGLANKANDIKDVNQAAATNVANKADKAKRPMSSISLLWRKTMMSLVGFVGCRRRQFQCTIDVSDDMSETCRKMLAQHLATSAFLVPFLARQCRVIFVSCRHVGVYIRRN